MLGTQKLFVITTMARPVTNQLISLGLHPKLLELIDIASRNELKNRSFFIREALVDALINRGAIVGLEQNDEIQDALISLCGSQL